MALELKQQVKLTQQLVMTPQLQQAIKLLQLSRMELVGLVQHELEENPVLEEVQEGEEERSEDTGETAADVAADASAEATRGGRSGRRSRAGWRRAEPDLRAEPAEEGAEAGEAVEARGEPEPTDAEKIADVDWQSYAESQPADGHARGRRRRRPALARRHAHAARDPRPSTCSGSSSSRRFPVEEEVAARFIIGNLDERGYLQSSIDEIARQSGVRGEVVEAALRKVQDFDPAGVAARDLRECLLIQVRALGIDDPLVLRILAATTSTR